MGLPGKAIEKMREAIKSAFPARDKLVMMLRIQLNIEESDVPNNSDYNQVVFDLITKLEREGRVPDLIKGALKEKPSNSVLQNLPEQLINLIDNNKSRDIYRQVNIIFLFTILIKLFESVQFNPNLIKQIKQSYKTCLSKYEDWVDAMNWEDEDKMPTNIADILDNLVDMSPNSEIETLVVKFAACLLAGLSEQKRSPEYQLKQLQKWVDKNPNNSDLFNKFSNNDSSRNESDIIPTHLIILLEPSQQYQNERYLVSAWFIYDGRNSKFNYQTAEGYKSLIQNQKQETFSLSEIPNLLESYLEQINEYCNDNSDLPTIEFFLSYKLLNEPIDTWKINIEEDFLRPLGNFYQVVVRSSYRLNKKYKFRNIWVQKWKSLINLTNQELSNNFLSGDFYSDEELRSKIDENSSIALILINPRPTREYFQVINSMGIPVALWFRQELKISNIQREIHNLLECSIIEFPKKVKQQRSCDFACNHEQRIGHHLSLLWENPYIVPPCKKEYTTP